MSYKALSLTLADVCTDVSYGYTESATNEPVGPKFLRITDIQGGSFDWEKVPFCPASEQDLGKYRLEVGDIVVARTGNSTGENAQVVTCPPPAVFASYLIRFRPDAKLVNPFFVGYQLRSERFRQHVLSVRGGSAQPGANAKQLGSFAIQLLGRELQDAVVEILRTLDDRIALLRETNATLEAIAQALFKSWFVDFDPVRAKMAGRDPDSMDEATAVLFPDSFEESELGLVPTGWLVRAISETCDIGRGASPRPIQKFMGGDVPWIKIADATASDGLFVFETKEMIIKEGVRHSVEVRPGDLIMSNSASCGITVFVELNGCIHDGWLYFRNYQHIGKYFLFFWLRKIADHLVHLADGSVQKNLNIALVSSQKIICPSFEVVQAFDKLAGPLLNRIRENCIQAQTLATLRDTLLPRLISGQLRLPEAA